MTKEKKERVPKASDLIADRIRRLIIRGELQPGDSLPSEVELMEQLDASRRALREALRVLESERFISIRRGARTGAQIHQPDAGMVARYAQYVLQSKGAKLSALYMARTAIGPYIARLLAEEGNSEKAGLLSEEIDKVKDNLDKGELLHAREVGTKFELRMAELLDNKALLLIYMMLEHLLEAYQLRYDVAPTLRAERDFDKAAKWWFRSSNRLVALIEKGDANGAERHWRKHLAALDEIWRTDQEELLRNVIS